jgi:hypothetical protein
MTWDDRVVRTADGYAIYEVYDDNGDGIRNGGTVTVVARTHCTLGSQ